MSVQVFRVEQRIAQPLADVFEFFSRASNLGRITPPWLSFTILGAEPADVGIGTVIPYRLRLHGVPLIWVSQIEQFDRDRLFTDRQLIGPYRQWVHRHEFVADGGHTVIRDEVRYELPLGRLGDIAHLIFVRRDVERIFRYRQDTLERLLLAESDSRASGPIGALSGLFPGPGPSRAVPR
jgi:ligand-binding SRPBCC domain-containing protein